MTVVRSAGELVAIDRPNLAPTFSAFGAGSLSLFDDLVADYAAIYRTQPAVRTCVKFLARNMGQLGLKLYDRKSDTDRPEKRDHPAALAVRKPNEWTTGYRWRSGTVHELGIYGNSLSIKAANPQTGAPGLIRIPWRMVRPLGSNFMRPEGYRLQGSAGYVDVDPSKAVHFRFYNPDDERWGISPLEALRITIAEDLAAANYRAQLWRNGARVSGVIERPAGQRWGETARQNFKQSWGEWFTAEAGTLAGGTPLLEDGMTFRDVSFSAIDSQFMESEKFRLETVAAIYYIQPPLIGILDHATFSNITEQHKNLYQDTLGPHCTMIEEDADLQILDVDFASEPGLYYEFNLAEKLKGSFEEQAGVIQTLVGRPVMTAAEGRGRLNLPEIADDPDADRLILPLNVVVSGEPAPGIAPPGPPALPPAASRDSSSKARRWKAALPTSEKLIEQHRRQIAKVFGRQHSTISSRVGAGEDALRAWDDARWNRELRDTLYPLAAMTIGIFGEAAAQQSGGTFDHERTLAWTAENARIAAERINGSTKAELAKAVHEAETPAAGVNQVFEKAKDSRAAQLAASRVVTERGFATHETARQSGFGSKTWLVVNKNPRPSHAQMSGETVPVDNPFSNGGMFPGDPALGADEVAGCDCILEFG